MIWGNPAMLQLLWLLIPATWVVLYALHRRQKKTEQLIAASLLPQLAPDFAPRRARTKTLTRLAAIALCIIALARPQWGFHWEEVKRRGLDILVLLDTSRSMLATDIKPDRLQRAKWGIRDLVTKLHGDRLGLITFAGSSFLQCPLTIDYAAFVMSLDDVYCGIIPRGGTAITDALKSAVDSFEYDTEADRAIVLVTDGEDHEGDPLKMIATLKKKNIRVFSVGVGTLAGELIPTKTETGHSGFLKNRAGNTVKSSLNEDILQRLALDTGGMYVHATPQNFGLETIYDRGINTLKRDEQESRMVKAHEDRFGWFLGLALLILLVEAMLSDSCKASNHSRERNHG